MPVQLWDHVQDPLDVDKKKGKQSPQEGNPITIIPETDMEHDQTSIDEKRYDLHEV